MSDQTTVPCPCHGHTVTLAPDKPPVGSRAAFTCPACGERRTFVRTADGAVFDPLPGRPDSAAPSPEAVASPAAPEAAPLWPAAPDRVPSPVPPGATVVLAPLAGPDTAPAWAEAVAAAFPEPRWHVLAADDPDQAVVDFLAHAPAVVVAGDSPAARAVRAAIESLPGRSRERLTLLLVGDLPEGDAMAAFTQSVDAVLARNDTTAMADRLLTALAQREILPSLFTAD